MPCTTGSTSISQQRLASTSIMSQASAGASLTSSCAATGTWTCDKMGRVRLPAEHVGSLIHLDGEVPVLIVVMIVVVVVVWFCVFFGSCVCFRERKTNLSRLKPTY